MHESIRSLIVAYPDKQRRIMELADSEPRFVKLANTRNALGREIYRLKDDRSRRDDVGHLIKMRRGVVVRLENFMM